MDKKKTKYYFRNQSYGDAIGFAIAPIVLMVIVFVFNLIDSDHTNAKIKVLTWIFAIGAVVSFVCGVVFFIIAVRNRFLLKNAVKKGKKYSGEIVRVEEIQPAGNQQSVTISGVDIDIPSVYKAVVSYKKENSINPTILNTSKFINDKKPVEGSNCTVYTYKGKVFFTDFEQISESKKVSSEEIGILILLLLSVFVLLFSKIFVEDYIKSLFM